MLFAWNTFWRCMILSTPTGMIRSMSLAFPLAILVGAVSAAAAPPTVLEYGLGYLDTLPTRADAFEHAHFVAAVSGLANRDAPQLFTPYAAIDIDADALWREALTRPGQWLANTSFTTLPRNNLPALVRRFSDTIRGVVLYDPWLPATSNVASTVAGVEHLVPVAYRPCTVDMLAGCAVDSAATVYEQIVGHGNLLPVVVDLVGRFNGSRSGSAKNDAYLWAIDEYLSAGRCDATQLAYYVDYAAATFPAPAGSGLGTISSTMITNHDWFIARKGFVFDLSPFADERPCDDVTQPIGIDRKTFEAILAAAYNQTRGAKMIRVAGQGPHVYKYSQQGSCAKRCKHGTIAAEDEIIDLLSTYNAYNDADDVELPALGMIANSAFWAHHPLPATLTQTATFPTDASLRARGLLTAANRVAPKAYASFYAGDYDGAAWSYAYLGHRAWDNGTRGIWPIGWGIDVELSTRFPPIFAHLYKTATENDFFISGDNGAGYLNPGALYPDYPPRRDAGNNASGAPGWKAWNHHWYERFDINLTGIVIGGLSGFDNRSGKLYAEFSSAGISTSPGTKEGGKQGVILHGGVPLLSALMSNLCSDPLCTNGGDLNVTASAATVIAYAQAQRKTPDRPTFWSYRTILCPVAKMNAVAAASVAGAEGNLEWVDPATLMMLARIACENGQIPCEKKD